MKDVQKEKFRIQRHNSCGTGGGKETPYDKTPDPLDNTNFIVIPIEGTIDSDGNRHRGMNEFFFSGIFIKTPFEFELWVYDFHTVFSPMIFTYCSCETVKNTSAVVYDNYIYVHIYNVHI